MFILGKAAALILAVCILFFSGSTAKSKEKSTEKAAPVKAEEAGWTLAFEDNFDRKEMGEHWQVINGDWKIDGGYMVGSGTLISKDSFPPKDETRKIYPDGNALGYIRMEFEAVSAIKPFVFFKDQKPEVVLGDLSCFINSRGPEVTQSPARDGYFFQFGGLYNTKNRITRAGREVATDDKPLKVIELEKPHKVIVENDEGTLRFYIDGGLVLEYKENGSIMGSGHDRVGFYIYTAVKIKNVKVYVKKLAGGLDRD